MNNLEMEGFLRGKCLPGDIKVNETNAEYLVRKIAGLEAQVKQLSMQLELSVAAERAWETTMMRVCGEDGPLSVAGKFNQLAAENGALKDLARGWANSTDDRLFEEHGEIFHDSIEDCESELKTICPATDAILASLRAEGVEMFALMYAEEAIKDGSDNTDWKARASAAASEYAAQLRSKSELQS